MAEASAATTIFRYRPSCVYSSGCACLSHVGVIVFPTLHQLCITAFWSREGYLPKGTMLPACTSHIEACAQYKSHGHDKSASARDPTNPSGAPTASTPVQP